MAGPQLIEVGGYSLVIEGARVWAFSMPVEARIFCRGSSDDRLALEHVNLGSDHDASELAWKAHFPDPDVTHRLAQGEWSGSTQGSLVEYVVQALTGRSILMLDGGGRVQMDLQSARPSPWVPPEPVDPGGPTKIKQTMWYELRVVDELGIPIEGVPLSLSVSGSPARFNTDGDGRVRVDDATTGLAVAWLPDIRALREAVRSRWEEARQGDWLNEENDHTYVDCAAPLPMISVIAERLHTIVVQPRVVCARVLELLFETNKAFLLPSALGHIRAVRELYQERPRAAVLIVGHTDATGEPSVNDPLSLARAESVQAYLRDDVDAWLDYYASKTPQWARWGSHEDLLMLEAVLNRSGEELTDTPLRHFQATRGLVVDNDLGPMTRRALIAEYMAADGTSLPPGTESVAHGCGENFPSDTPSDGEADHVRDRRVELFFFDADLGVLPPPAGEISAAGSPEYPEWRRRAAFTHDFRARPLWEVRFIDREGNPMPEAPFAVCFGRRRPIFGVANEAGIGAIDLPPQCPERVFIAWGPPVGQRDFSFARTVHVDCTSGARESSVTAMLHNLGYAPHLDLGHALQQFDLDEGEGDDPHPIGSPDDGVSDPTARAIEAAYGNLKGAG